jgi:hypothetical protein
MVDSSRSIWAMRDLHRIETLLRILGALLLDLVLVLQGAQLCHALAEDRALAHLERAFDATILGQPSTRLASISLALASSSLWCWPYSQKGPDARS